MNEIIKNITSYIKHLQSNFNMHISVHFNNSVIGRLPQNTFSELLPYNSHSCVYCMKVKQSTHHKCIGNQKSILQNCHKNNVFCNTCYAGVSEMIYPFRKDADIAGYIAVSGYKTKDFSDYNINDFYLYETSLKDEALPYILCNAVIPPLCIMFEYMFTFNYAVDSDNEYNRILQFLNEYHTNISLSDLCSHFNRSASHISHLFKKESGMSIRAFCNDLKLKDSQKMLLTTDCSVTDAALNSGFNDISYYIYLFKKKYGISPLKYRLKNKPQ